jgi:hypothetical protein
MIAGESTLFEDDEYLVTTKRFVKRRYGVTLLIREMTDPFIETSENKGDLIDQAGDFVKGLFGKATPNGMHEGLVVKVQGRRQEIASIGYVPAWHEADEIKNRQQYLRTLAEAVGAAIANA